LTTLKIFKTSNKWGLGIGDWGIGDWPIPNPQSPIPLFANKLT
jgi:hypothetical protein